MTAENKPFFISTTIPYVNAAPHLGHALEFVQTDAIARYRRLRGHRVHFVSGSDENSLKNARAAEREGTTTAELVERYSARYVELGRALALSTDDFIRTSTDPRHAPAVRRIWELCSARGDIYRKKYQGLYCVGCEQFYRPSDLTEGGCPEHGNVVEPVAEENYFFRLSRYEKQLASILSTGQVRIEPEERRNEAIAFVSSGLDDFSISRSRERAKDWGLEVPGDPSEVVYVWFDALANYVSVLDFAQQGAPYGEFWAGQGSRVHVLGKGVLRFHAVYWLAILLSAGLPLPTDLLVHGYVTVEGKKIGKSLGNALDPFSLVTAHGTDALRYYLLRHQHSTKDGDFSRTALALAHDAELADQLGNLLNRVVALIERYLGGVVAAQSSEAPRVLIDAAEAARLGVEESFERFALHDAVRSVWELVAAGNRYVDSQAPWKLARLTAARRELEAVLADLCELCRVVAVLASPFVPRTAATIHGSLGAQLPKPGEWDEAARFRARRPETRVAKAGVLFPKQRFV